MSARPAGAVPGTTAQAPPAGIDSGRAWLMAAVAAVAVAICFGTTYSFGAFFEAMRAEFDAGAAATALVFGITVMLFFGLGVVSGPVADRIGPSRLLVVSAASLSVGLVATSRVEAVWVGYVTFGAGVGVAAGLTVTPLFAAVGGWFVRGRALALAVTSAGSGLGTLVLVPASEALIEAYGWRTAFVVLAVVGGSVLLVAAAVVRRPPVPPPPAVRAHLGRVARREEFRVLFAGNVLFSVGIFLAFAFIVSFATENGVASATAARLVAVVGASSIAARVAMGGLARRLGPVRLFQIALLTQPVAYLVWLVAGGSVVLLAVFAVLLGTSYGGFVSLAPTVTAEVFGVVGLGGVLGALSVGGAVGGLVGPVLAGVLRDATDGQGAPIAVALGAALVAGVLTLRLPAGRRAGEPSAPPGNG